MRSFGVSPATTGGSNVVAGTYGTGVFFSSDDGASWNSASANLSNEFVRSFAVISNGPGASNLFAGTEGGVFLSSDNGTNWTQVNAGLIRTFVYCLATAANGAGGTNLFAGTPSGLFRSSDAGTSWVRLDSGFTSKYIYSLAASPNGAGGSYLFAGTDGEGVFLSTDNGSSWTPANTGLANNYVYTLVVNGNDLYAGTDGGVYRRPLANLITSVEQRSADLPLKFSLGQNYPNPFNPTTTIPFSLSSRTFVSLIVYDALGRKVSVLRSEELPAGEYLQRWVAANIPSGIYFYRLQAGPLAETRKLILLK